MLRQDFQRMRVDVLRTVVARLGSTGVRLDDADLDACYANAWQGLYAAVLAGEEIESPAGWLITVCFRRAIDEHRSRLAPGRQLLARDGACRSAAGDDGDFVSVLDAKQRLLQLFEGLSSSMSARERQVVSLCFLQGLSRAQAAQAMGISPRQMERLMDGRGRGREGVSAKVAAVAETVAGGHFCQERASMMRALAFGMLDPQGERHRIALVHQRSCPACRAYVLELRGLAATFPPISLPSVLELLRGSARATAVRTVRATSRSGRAAGTQAGRAAGARTGRVAAMRAGRTAALQAGQTVTSSAGQAAGTQGVASTLGTKLAAAGVAAGLALGGGVYAITFRSPGHASRRTQTTTAASTNAGAPLAVAASSALLRTVRVGPDALVANIQGPSSRGARGTASTAALAWQEFGFERPPAAAGRHGAARARSATRAGARSSPRRSSRVERSRVAAMTPTRTRAPALAAANVTTAAEEAIAGARTATSVSAGSARARAFREFGAE